LRAECFFGSNRGAIRAMDMETGEPAWRAQAQFPREFRWNRRFSAKTPYIVGVIKKNASYCKKLDRISFFLYKYPQFF